MSRIAEVIVLASNAQEIMEPLTRRDPNRKWSGQFAAAGHGWVAEFVRRSGWVGLLEDLESQPWPSPHSVQVLIHDEEDDCFGLWMMHDGRLVEVPLPRTSRYFWRNHYTGEVDADCPGILMRTDKSDASPEGD
ncbi:hypothetical protein [Streptomyces collinus]|uniref:Uncharacterized protein n=1 Tax=Streptomyces collinus (strain DSM 40733 / Tue 365) TaxID=1214242 RepID=S5VM84_STRC3|nr:hypothetical protein [Streptomyces collinus]AGS71657.1 hypothetical protein B446_24230 [Streptomyces collinus Tu 365]UJA10302.1 hypothetical protein HGI10_42640 [Streptomyces collinus]UJA14834.1 hypothetical protein HGI09_21480 [Streptomyces collinus]